MYRYNQSFYKAFKIVIEMSAVKVTVHFETEGNGQNEIISHMDRSEVKL